MYIDCTTFQYLQFALQSHSPKSHPSSHTHAHFPIITHSLAEGLVATLFKICTVDSMCYMIVKTFVGLFGLYNSTQNGVCFDMHTANGYLLFSRVSIISRLNKCTNFAVRIKMEIKTQNSKNVSKTLCSMMRAWSCYNIHNKCYFDMNKYGRF